MPSRGCLPITILLVSTSAGAFLGWYFIDWTGLGYIRALIGLCFGGSIGVLALVNMIQHRSAKLLVAGSAASLFFVSIALVAYYSEKGTMGTVVVAGIVAVALFWALTKARQP